MKKVFVCAVLTLVAPLAAHDILPGGGYFASLQIVPENVFCTPLIKGTDERFKDYSEGMCFDSELNFKIDAAGKKQTKQRALQKMQASAKDCKRVERKLSSVYPKFVQDVCPQEGEDLTAYFTRLTPLISMEGNEKQDMLPTQDLFAQDFWTMSTPLQCGLLALNIDVGLISVNDNLPILGHTPLQFAVDKGNLDLVYFLLERGASENGLSGDTFDRLFEAMRKSTDERSVAALSVLNRRSHLLLADWAKDMSPDLVRKKASILLPNYGKTPFRKSLADVIEGDSPGEQVLREYIMRYGYWFDFDCVIL